MVRENCKRVVKKAGSILLGLLLLLGVLLGYDSWNASASAENASGGGFSKTITE